MLLVSVYTSYEINGNREISYLRYTLEPFLALFTAYEIYLVIRC